MKKKLIILAAALGIAAMSGCSTSVYNANGKLAMRTYGDSTKFAYKGADGAVLTADRFSHSVPTRASGTAATSVITAAGTAVATGGAL